MIRYYVRRRMRVHMVSMTVDDTGRSILADASFAHIIKPKPLYKD